MAPSTPSTLPSPSFLPSLTGLAFHRTSPCLFLSRPPLPESPSWRTHGPFQGRVTDTELGGRGATGEELTAREHLTPGPTSGSAGTGMPVIQRRGARPAYSRGGFPFRGPRKALRDPPTEAHTRQGPPEASPLLPLRGPFPGSLCLPPTKATADPRKVHLWNLLLAKSQKVSL